MNILLTGGSGLIGRHFIRRYPDYSYTVLTRHQGRAGKRLPASVALIDSLDGLTSLDGFDAVINLCGAPIADRRWTAARKQLICESRWSVTQRLVDLCLRGDSPPRVFISGSAIGFYGPTGDDEMSEQDLPRHRDFAHEICSRWEDIARGAESRSRVVLLRTGVVLTEDGGALQKMLPPFRVGLGGRIGSGDQYMSWIHLDDELAAIHWLLNNDNAVGAYNLTAPQPVTNNEFTELLASSLGSRPRLPVPAFALRLLMGEASSLLLDSQRIVPQKLTDEGFEFQYPQLTAALGSIFSTP